jgi:hypothetical protein
MPELDLYTEFANLGAKHLQVRAQPLSKQAKAHHSGLGKLI